MKRFLLVGLLLSLQLNLGAASADNFKHDSYAFCDVLYYNNSLDTSLNRQFVFDCAKLISVAKGMMSSLDDIAMIQITSGVSYNLEQQAIINKHILDLNIIRKHLLRIKNKHQISSQLSSIFDDYRNSIDAHYYELNPSYESYLLKQCNVSLKNTKYISMYAAGSLVSGLFSATTAANCIGSAHANDFEARHGQTPRYSLVHFNGLLATSVASLTIGSLLAYCAYKKINDPEYEFELLAIK